MLKKYKVKSINNYEIELVDELEKEIKLLITFLGFELNVEDEFIIEEKLLSDIENQYVTFGDLRDMTGRDLQTMNEEMLLEEVIMIRRNDKIYYLKRLYG